ncbi:MAG: hypothetical protein Q8P50_01540 [Bacillota bacterium]|nr:hypothetical protein [Bacillota bacterium]
MDSIEPMFQMLLRDLPAKLEQATREPRFNIRARRGLAASATANGFVRSGLEALDKELFDAIDKVEALNPSHDQWNEILSYGGRLITETYDRLVNDVLDLARNPEIEFALIQSRQFRAEMDARLAARVAQGESALGRRLSWKLRIAVETAKVLAGFILGFALVRLMP